MLYLSRRLAFCTAQIREIRGGAETAARVRGRGQCAWNSVVGVFAPGMHVLCRSTYIVHAVDSTVQEDSIRKNDSLSAAALKYPRTPF